VVLTRPQEGEDGTVYGWVHVEAADEALFLTVEGFVMEGPISSVVMRRGNDLLTPDPGIGILEGTTQRDVFAHAPSLGLKPL
jgi:4-amino-4-deoxychorismate lyase